LHPQQTPPPQLYTLSLHDALPICPSALSSGKPPLHLSCRALSEDARASSEASSARSASARSRPGPLKKGSGGKSVMMSERKRDRSEEHTSELQSQSNLVCRLLLEK